MKVQRSRVFHARAALKEESGPSPLDQRLRTMAAPIELKDRFRGSLLGLAVGDAVGTTVDTMARGTFPPITDMVGGGKYRLLPGQVRTVVYTREF